MIDAESPEALWLALRMVQAVLRESPSALAWSSSVKNPADLIASANSLIFADCRAFILAVSGSGRWLRPCTRGADDGQTTSDGCDCIYLFPLVGIIKEPCHRTYVSGCTSTPCFDWHARPFGWGTRNTRWLNCAQKNSRAANQEGAA
jgi:hypothetical protein